MSYYILDHGVVTMEYARIRHMREDRDMSQKEIAVFLNVAQRTYSGYESGSRNIPVQIVVKLAKYYSVSTDYLLGLTDIKQPYPAKGKRHDGAPCGK